MISSHDTHQAEEDGVDWGLSMRDEADVVAGLGWL